MLSGRVATFALPAGLVRNGYALRDENDRDVLFLQILYATTRQTEMAAISGWGMAQKQLFLAQQFAAQRSHFRTRIAGCRFMVIERHGLPIGRLYLQPCKSRIHVVDIALLPEARGNGLGTAILQAVIDWATVDEHRVSLVVERGNPAFNLYRRLDFVLVRETEMYMELECHPPGKHP